MSLTTRPNSRLLVQRMPVEEVMPLRHRYLRRGQPFESCRWDFDDDPRSIHLGATDGESVVGVVSLVPMPPPPEGSPRWLLELEGVWRIRGGVVAADYWGLNILEMLGAVADAHVVRMGIPAIWAQIRPMVLEQTIAQGYEVLSGPFEVPGIGPHYFVVRRFA